MNCRFQHSITPACRTSRSCAAWCLMGAFCAALLITGCASQVASHVFLKQSYPARPDNQPVDIFTNDLPTRPFERVAVIDVHCESQYFAPPDLQKDAFPLFRREARAAGCDAVIEIKEAKQPSNWTLETRTKHFTGVGIMYK